MSMELHTERLLLRTPRAADASRLLEYHESNRAHFAPWDPQRSEEFYTMGFWEAQARRTEAAIERGEMIQFLLLDPPAPAGPILGHASFTNIVRGPFQAATLGYALAQAAVGRGLMTEALREAIRHLFQEQGLHRIMANHMPRNTRSAALLARLGFRREGFARDYLRIAGRWEDHVLTSLVNPEWTED
jgi:ribosomal-protein-alanine N-acetyltransferase